MKLQLPAFLKKEARRRRQLMAEKFKQIIIPAVNDFITELAHIPPKEADMMFVNSSPPLLLHQFIDRQPVS